MRSDIVVIEVFAVRCLMETEMKGSLKRSCPHCRSQETSRSHRRGLIEKYLLPSIRVRPYRCARCDARFYALSQGEEQTSSATTKVA